MNKTLTAVTLLTAASAFAAAPATTAKSSDKPITMSIFGSGYSYINFTKLKHGKAKNPDLDFDANITFMANGMTDGIGYGFGTRLHTRHDRSHGSTGSAEFGKATELIDFWSMYISNYMGKLSFGSEWSATATMFNMVPGNAFVSSTGSLSGQLNEIASLGWGDWLGGFSERSNKVSYYGEFSGISVGLSYTPVDDHGTSTQGYTLADINDKVDSDGNPAPLAHDLVEGQMKYSDEMFSFGAGFQTLSQKGAEHKSSYNVTGAFSMDDLALGASYVKKPNLAGKDSITVGASYKLSKEASLGAQYYRATPFTGKAKNSFLLGMDYAVTSQVRFSAGLTQRDDKGWAVSTGLNYNFALSTS